MSSKKHKARELAMQVLFVWDAHSVADPAWAEQVVSGGSPDVEVRQTALGMAQGAWEQRQVADQWIERLAPQWPPRRQPGVDRNLLRLGVWELTCASTPPKVVIDEAIELAKQYSTEQSAAFVNGVLDAVLKERDALKQAHAPNAQIPDAQIPDTKTES
jgi:N utilization substance protein B